MQTLLNDKNNTEVNLIKDEDGYTVTVYAEHYDIGGIDATFKSYDEAFKLYSYILQQGFLGKLNMNELEKEMEQYSKSNYEQAIRAVVKNMYTEQKEERLRRLRKLWREKFIISLPWEDFKRIADQITGDEYN